MSDEQPAPDEVDAPSEEAAHEVHPRHAVEGTNAGEGADEAVRAPGAPDDPHDSDGDRAPDAGAVLETSAEPGAGAPRSRRVAWGSLLRPRFNTSQAIVAVLCAALGFAFIVQVRQNQTDTLSSLRQSDLVRLLDDVTQRSQTLEKEYSSLRVTRDELQAGSGSQQAAIKLAQQRAATQGILSGRLPADGPGITLKVTEGTQSVGAQTMFNVLEELRNAGAEAVQVNGVRLVASSWFAVAGNTLVADGVPISSPYEWTAIGDPDTLAPALGIPGGALAAVRGTGATADLASSKKVKITATVTPTTPQYATPVPVATKAAGS